MTYPTEITLPFADGTYRFWLPIPQVNELESKLASFGGPVSMFGLEWQLRQSISLAANGDAVFAGGGDAVAKAVRETIRLGLIGGGFAVVDDDKVEVGPNRAKELLEAYVYPARPLAEAAALAWRVLAAAIYGNEPNAPTDDKPSSSGDAADEVIIKASAAEATSKIAARQRRKIP